MLNSLLQDGVSNNAGQLVIETVPVEGADSCANSLCAEAGSRRQCLSSLKAPLMLRIALLRSALQDGVSNNAGQLVIDTVPVQGAD